MTGTRVVSRFIDALLLAVGNPKAFIYVCVRLTETSLLNFNFRIFTYHRLNIVALFNQKKYGFSFFNSTKVIFISLSSLDSSVYVNSGVNSKDRSVLAPKMGPKR